MMEAKGIRETTISNRTTMVTEVDPNSRHFSASSLMVGRAAHTEISAPMLMALMSSDNPHRWNSNTTTKDL